MGITEEREKVRLVLEKVDEFDIHENQDPKAIYERGKSSFAVYCKPEDHPEGWGEEAIKTTRNFPREFVARIYWRWKEGLITHLEIALQVNPLYLLPPNTTHDGYFNNRPEDIRWTKEKARWLFEQAGVPLPEFIVIHI